MGVTGSHPVATIAVLLFSVLYVDMCNAPFHFFFGVWDTSSLIRDGNWAPCSGSKEF